MAMDWVKMQLQLAFSQPGCAFCRLRQDAERSYVLSLLGERFTDGATRQRLRSHLGLCHTHAWALQAAERQVCRTGMATGIMYQELAEQVLESLVAYLDQQLPAPAMASADTAVPQSMPLWRRLTGWVAWRWSSQRQQVTPYLPVLLARLTPAAECPACEAVTLAETAAKEWLARCAADTEFRASYAASDGLCLPHLRGVLAETSDREVACWLVENTAQKLRVLLHDLSEYLRKHSWQYHHEPKPAWEQASWIRAVGFMAGEAPPAVEEYIQRARCQAQSGHRQQLAKADIDTVLPQPSSARSER
jgi:hypothetical protein